MLQRINSATYVHLSQQHSNDDTLDTLSSRRRALATTVLISLLALISLTTFIIPANLDPASLKLSSLNVVLGRSNYERHAKAREFAFIKYDLVAGEFTQRRGSRRHEAQQHGCEAEADAGCSLLLSALDLSPLFNWNTKQVFVSLVADYSTTKYVRLCLRSPLERPS